MAKRQRESLGPQIAKPKLKFPTCRHILYMMAFYGFFNVYSLRLNLSVAMVSMVNATAVAHTAIATSAKADNSCSYLAADLQDTSPNVQPGTFVWKPKEVTNILAAFYYGYIVTQIPGGMLALKFGGKYITLFGIAADAILNLITPACVKHGGYWALFIVRVVDGLVEGVTFPAAYVLLGQWATPAERSRMATFVYSGTQVGALVALPVSGLMCRDVGWEYVFYLFGCVGIVWSILWLALVYDSPDKHPRIQPEEKEYIDACLGTGSDDKQHQVTIKSVPWKQIFKSPPVYAIITAHVANNWGSYMLMTCMPTYMKQVLYYDIKSNGTVSGLPYLVMWALVVATGLSVDEIRSRGLVSTTVIRKICVFIGFIIPGALLVGVGYVGCNRTAALVLLFLSIGLNGISVGGWACNMLDLSPIYAGTLMGISNTVATIPGIVVPLIVGVFTDNDTSANGWQKAFWVAGAVYLVGTLVFLIAGSGRRQPWGLPPAHPEHELNPDWSATVIAPSG